MRPINRQPFGFLDFFGLKSLGKNPEVMNDQVQPTLDMREWYLRTNAEQLRGLVQLVAPYTGPASDPFAGDPSLTVPAGEWWYVHAATLVVFQQPGWSLITPGIMTVRNSAPAQYYEALLSTTRGESFGTGTVAYSASWHSRPRCWLPPRTEIGASWVSVDDPGPPSPGDVLNFNIHLSITRAHA